MTFPRWSSWTILACMVAAAGGCGGLKQPFPQKELFALDAAPAAGPATTPALSDGLTLRVYRFRIAPPFDAKQFAYRVGDNRYETDYYNGFAADPAELLTGQAVRWLGASGLFKAVVPASGRSHHDLLLEVNVTELYADYRDKAAPKAVMGMKVFLLDDRADQLSVVGQWTYSSAARLDRPGPADLVGGWNQAYREILTQMTEDLRPAAASGRGQ